MSATLYFVTKLCSAGKTTLWPMGGYGEICTSMVDAEAQFNAALERAKSGTSLSLESQRATVVNGHVVKMEGAASVLKTVKK